MKPIIGITPEIAEDGKVSLNYAYTHAIEAAGGIPLVLPCTEDEGLLDRLANLCHGFCFSGGEDIEPARYGEEKHPKCGAPALRRDAFDFAMFRKALATGKPILGICRGGQLINVALGGTLWQDLPSQCGTVHSGGHTCVHKTKLVEGTLLHRLYGDEMTTNSYHHQAIDRVAEGFRVTATAEDGTIEALSHETLPIGGTQWHPERMTGVERFEHHGPDSAPIFAAFIESCKK